MTPSAQPGGTVFVETCEPFASLDVGSRVSIPHVELGQPVAGEWALRIDRKDLVEPATPDVDLQGNRAQELGGERSGDDRVLALRARELQSSFLLGAVDVGLRARLGGGQPFPAPFLEAADAHALLGSHPFPAHVHQALIELRLVFEGDPSIAVAHHALGDHVGLFLGADAHVALLGRHPLALVTDEAEIGPRPLVIGVELDHALHAALGLVLELLLLTPLPELVVVRHGPGCLPTLLEYLGSGLAALDLRDLGPGELHLSEASLDRDLVLGLLLDLALEAAAVLEQHLVRVGARARQCEDRRGEKGENARSGHAGRSSLGRTGPAS